MLPPPLRPCANVLVVDDDGGVRGVCTALLHLLGYLAVQAESGDAALGQLESGYLPDVVLLDVRMPGLDGTQVLAAIAAQWPGVRVVVMSGFVRDELSSHLDAGADAVLRKPFGVDELKAALSIALATRQGGAKAA